MPWASSAAAGELGILRADAEASRAIGHGLRELGEIRGGRVGAHGEHDAGWIGGRLGVGELAERDHLAPPFLDAVAPSNAEVEEAVGHVDRDLLGTQDPHLIDARVVDAGSIGHVRGAVHGQVCVLEQLHGGAFERALGQDEAEHGGQSSQTAAGGWGKLGPCRLRTTR